MVLLWIIIVLVAFLPVVFIWLPIMTKTRAKVVVCIASVFTAIFFLTACVKYSDNEDLVDSLMNRNYNYIACIDDSDTVKEFERCVINNIEELSEIYSD